VRLDRLQGLHWLELVPSDIVTVDAGNNRVQVFSF